MTERMMTRRQFLVGVGASAVAVAATGFSGCTMETGAAEMVSGVDKENCFKAGDKVMVSQATQKVFVFLGEKDNLLPEPMWEKGGFLKIGQKATVRDGEPLGCIYDLGREDKIVLVRVQPDGDKKDEELSCCWVKSNRLIALPKK